MKIHYNEQSKNHQMKTISSKNELSSASNVRHKKSFVNIPIVKSEERAKAIFSLLVLLEHRDHWNWNDGFMVDWTDSETNKWCITEINDQIDIINTSTNKKLLSFRNKESSIQFLETFNKLIYTAKDLL